MCVKKEGRNIFISCFVGLPSRGAYICTTRIRGQPPRRGGLRRRRVVGNNYSVFAALTLFAVVEIPISAARII